MSEAQNILRQTIEQAQAVRDNLNSAAEEQNSPIIKARLMQAVYIIDTLLPLHIEKLADEQRGQQLKEALQKKVDG